MKMEDGKEGRSERKASETRWKYYELGMAGLEARKGGAWADGPSCMFDSCRIDITLVGISREIVGAASTERGPLIAT
jgi:hypothetical protein